MTLAAGLALAPAARAQRCSEGPIALVLSGGGARGYAHVGLLRALDSLRIRPDLIVGTSMGAIIGALYASGYSAADLDSLLARLGTEDPFRRIGPRVPRAWGALLPLVGWEQDERGIRFRNPAVREAYVNAYLNAVLLQGNLQARGDFDRLPIRFRAVATDLANQEPVVLGSGDLAQSVRASMAIPLVFSPTRVQGKVLADGGLSANVPIAAARSLGARRLIVSDVTERIADPRPAEGPLSVLDRLMGFLFTQRLDSLGAADAYVRPEVQEFRSLDFSPDKLASIEREGRRAADSTLARAECFPRSERPALPALPSVVGPLTMTGGHPGDQRLLAKTLRLDPPRLDAEALRRRLRAAGDGDPFAEFWLVPSGSGDTVGFAVELARAPRRLAGLGLAYDADLSGRFWAGALERRLLGTGVELSLVGSVGRFRDEASIALRRTSTGATATSPLIRLFGGREQIRRFDSGAIELSTAPTDQARLFVGLEQGLGGGWLVELGGEALSWENPDATERSALGAALRAFHQPEGSPRLVQAEVSWTRLWRRAQLVAGNQIELRRLRLEPSIRIGWGRHLPLHEQFALGGEMMGFPGLRYGERRGDREALVALQTSWVFKLPFSVRLLASAGRSAQHGPLLDTDGWIAGARAGLGLDSPFGPFAVEYGLATDGSGAVHFRAGRWF